MENIEINEHPEQYFPTYKIGKDIGLAEYQAASSTLQSEERIFSFAASILTFSISVLGSIFALKFKDITDLLGIKNDSSFYIFWAEANLFFFGLTILFFAQRQKEIAFAARKIIVLRRMLGLTYGKIQLVLPIWRIEGANEPFSIPIFSGWNHYTCFPIYLICAVSTGVLYVLVLQMEIQVNPFYIALYSIALLVSYRRSLYDYHENGILMFSKLIGQLPSILLVQNFEYVIYRAKLSIQELNRLQVDLKNLSICCIFLEDRTYYKHYGISIRGILRAVINYIRYQKRSGGSTITQQLVRTLFIRAYSNLLIRKIQEVILAFWAERVFSKDEILMMYLASVRFEKNVFGVAAAMSYFFDGLIRNPTLAQSFFLVERISNIQTRFLGHKVKKNVTSAIEVGLLTHSDALELLTIYRAQIISGKIKEIIGPGPEEISRVISG